MKPEEAAERVLKDLNIREIPIPVDKLAQKIGAAISYEPFDGKDEISGVLIKEADRMMIGINSSHARTRQRFTIAHEIGHLVLKHRGDIFVDKTERINRDTKSTLAIDKNEIEANAFAAALLMPRAHILKEIQNRPRAKTAKKEPPLANYLAGIFQVSKQAMEYRLNNLGLLIPE